MVQIVNLNEEIAIILDEYSSPHWPVIVNPCCRQLLALVVHLDSILLEPLFFSYLQSWNLLVRSIQISEYLNDFPLNLKLRFLSHEGSEGSPFKISTDLNLEILDPFELFINFSELINQHICLKILEVVLISKIKVGMQIFDDRCE